MRGIFLTVLTIFIIAALCGQAFCIQSINNKKGRKPRPTYEITDTEAVVPDNFATIQEAIDAVGSGDTVFVRSGTYIENVVISKPLKLIGENKLITIVDGNDTGSAVTITSSNVTVTGFTLQHGGPDFPEGGILMDAACDNNISHNIVINNAMGVLFYGSSRNLIDNNVISDNWYGIELYGYSHQNIFSNNNLSNNVANFLMFRSSNNMVINNNVSGGNFGFVVERCRYNTFNCNIVSNIGWSGFRILDGCSSNQLLGNIVSDCLDAFEFSDSSNNTLVANVVFDARRYAIFIAQAHNNTIACNEILNNVYGITLYETSKGNTIYHNNIINNTYQAYLMFSPTNNTWDNGYLSGGNYWSDYNGTDQFRGVYQNETGSDGVGDNAYTIDQNNTDRYPLMKPWTAIKPSIPATITIYPRVLNLKSHGKWVSCLIELPEEYSVKDVNVSTIMLNQTVSANTKHVSIRDRDHDSIPELKVKFNRAEVIELIRSQIERSCRRPRFMVIMLTITGYLNDGMLFQGQAAIKIISFFGHCPKAPKWEPPDESCIRP